MLDILLAENAKLTEQMMEIEAAQKVAAEMIPPEIRRLLAQQAAAAQRLEKAKAAGDVDVVGLSRPLASTGAPKTAGGSAAWTIPFGKHKGTALGLLATDYLAWCLAQAWLRPEARRHMENVIRERRGKP
jgi:hypothetical protein